MNGRDALRTDAALRAVYQALELQLAAELRHARESYTDAKAPFRGLYWQHSEASAPMTSQPFSLAHRRN